MASRELSALTPGFANTVRFVKKEFDFNTPEGVTLLVYCTWRPMREQAILFRQGRSWAAVKARMTRLTNKGFPELAKIIDDVGPQSSTKRVTGAGPGESWHNYRQAVDAVPIQGGNAIWNSDSEYWAVYGAAAKHQGLIWGKSFGDKPHIQVGIKGNPLDHFTTKQVREILKL